MFNLTTYRLSRTLLDPLALSRKSAMSAAELTSFTHAHSRSNIRTVHKTGQIYRTTHIYVQVLSTIYNHFPDAATLSQVYSGRCYTLSRCPKNVPFLGSWANIRSKSTPVYHQKSSKNWSKKQKQAPFVTFRHLERHPRGFFFIFRFHSAKMNIYSFGEWKKNEC